MHSAESLSEFVLVHFPLPLSHYSDFKQFRPQLSGDEEPITG
jgi:hypothetical protein